MTSYNPQVPSGTILGRWSVRPKLPSEITFMRRLLLIGALSLLAVSGFSRFGLTQEQARKSPNVVFIMADDLGYGELGCYGQQKIQTPHLDRLAQESLRFTQYYAGATVCAPSRSVLMTGLHTGHTRVRGNSSPDKQTLRDDDVTLAELFKQAGYVTGLTGKWGLGDSLPGGEPGLPTRQGFDVTFGYLNQHHAHNYFPPFLFQNDKRIELPNEGEFDARGAGKVRVRKVYAHDLIAEQSQRFLRENKSKPFFLYCAWTLPHANNEHKEAGIPDHGIYKDKDWSEPNKMHAAMVSYLDTQVGQLLATLDELGLRDSTLVCFTSDNGPHRESGNDPNFFNSSGLVRGTKRDLYDGGIRVPLLVRWPGRIAPGVSDHIAYHGDILATTADLIGFKTPPGLDSVSFAPTLLGRAAEQKPHEFLYWEFYEGGGARAVRWGKWKAVRPKWHAPIELFDITTDPRELQNVAAEHADLVQQIDRMMQESHRPSADWPEPASPKRGPKAAG